MNLKCLAGFHEFDANCSCVACKVVQHDFEESDTFAETGNYETSCEPWLTEMRRTTTRKCRRCGETVVQDHGTAYYL